MMSTRLFQTSLAIAIFGLLATLYSAQHQIDVDINGKSNASCNISETISCDTVAKSPYSKIAGIPVAILGVGYFLSSIFLLVLAKNSTHYHEGSYALYGAFVICAVAASLVMASISLFIIKVACPSCLAIYLACFAQAARLWFAKPLWNGLKKWEAVVPGAFGCALLMILSIGGYHYAETSQAATAAQNRAATQPQHSQIPKKIASIPLSKSPYTGLGEDYRKGGDQAKLVINEFADFQCPACGVISDTMSEVHKLYGDKVLIVYRNYPLDAACNKNAKVHPHACEASTVARCAGQYGKFWQMHDKLYTQQKEITPGNMRKWASELGLSDTQLDACLSSKDIRAKIADDVALGDSLGINGTPTLYFNGEEYDGPRDLPSIKKVIDSKL